MELYKKDPHTGMCLIRFILTFQCYQIVEEMVDMYKDVLLIENCWRGAEAYHFYLLAHRQFYAGQLIDAICTLFKLESYTSHIPLEEIYSLLAVCAYLSGLFNLCSKMFVKINSLAYVRNVMDMS